MLDYPIPNFDVVVEFVVDHEVDLDRLELHDVAGEIQFGCRSRRAYGCFIDTDAWDIDPLDAENGMRQASYGEVEIVRIRLVDVDFVEKIFHVCYLALNRGMARKGFVGFWKDAFQDDDGNVSMVRLLSFIALIAACAIAAADFVGGSIGETNSKYYFTMLLIGAFAPKVLQKYLEGLMKIKPRRTI